MLRIGVDFNTMNQDERARVSINVDVHPYLLDYLKPGLIVVLFEAHDIEVEATIEFDEIYHSWYGLPDWSTRRVLPDQQ